MGSREINYEDRSIRLNRSLGQGPGAHAGDRHPAPTPPQAPWPGDGRVGPGRPASFPNSHRSTLRPAAAPHIASQPSAAPPHQQPTPKGRAPCSRERTRRPHEGATAEVGPPAPVEPSDDTALAGAQGEIPLQRIPWRLPASPAHAKLGCEADKGLGHDATSRGL